MKEYDKKIKAQAVKLRKTGLSYGKIFKELKVPKSTLSTWLKDISIKKEHRDRLYTKQVLLITNGKYSQKNIWADEKDRIIKSGMNEISDPISLQTYKLFGAALYWAEGTKGSLFEITNSDPKLILFMVLWIRNVFGINPNELKARLNIHSGQDDIKIKKYWSQLCGIPISNFGKSYIKPKNNNFKKNILYFGTIKINIQKSTHLKYRLFGWNEKILQDIIKQVELANQSV